MRNWVEGIVGFKNMGENVVEKDKGRIWRKVRREYRKGGVEDKE